LKKDVKLAIIILLKKDHMKNKMMFGLSILAILLSWPIQTLAFCPICTVAAAAAVGLSRWVGVDDTISGLWIGGLTVSTIGWTINRLRKKNVSAWWISTSVALAYYALIVIPFYKTNIISFHPQNSLWGVDKILLGLILGSIFFLFGHSLYQVVKERNGGHAHFPFEKIVFPVATLLILSGIFYFITK
jgi:hypothetical protein